MASDCRQEQCESFWEIWEEGLGVLVGFCRNKPFLIVLTLENVITRIFFSIKGHIRVTMCIVTN